MSWFGVYNNHGTWAYDSAGQRSGDLPRSEKTQLGVVLLHLDTGEPKIRGYFEAFTHRPIQLTAEYVPDDPDEIFGEFVDSVEWYLAEHRGGDLKQPGETAPDDEHAAFTSLYGDGPEFDAVADWSDRVVRLRNRGGTVDLGLPDYETAVALARALYRSDRLPPSTIAVTKSRRFDPIADVDVVLQVGEFDAITPLGETPERLRQAALEPLDAAVDRFVAYADEFVEGRPWAAPHLADRLQGSFDTGLVHVLDGRGYALRLAAAVVAGAVGGGALSAVLFAPFASGVRAALLSLVESNRGALFSASLGLFGLWMLLALVLVFRRFASALPRVTGLSVRIPTPVAAPFRRLSAVRAAVGRLFRVETLLAIIAIDGVLALLWAVPLLV